MATTQKEWLVNFRKYLRIQEREDDKRSMSAEPTSYKCFHPACNFKRYKWHRMEGCIVCGECHATFCNQHEHDPEPKDEDENDESLPWWHFHGPTDGDSCPYCNGFN